MTPTCRECGQPFTAKRAHGENLFCAVECRKAWNNRRAVRGAQLYDLFLILRYQRGIAKTKGVWSIMCRLAQDWREEDHRERAGRQSWREYAVLHDGLLPQRIQKLSGLDYSTHRGAFENGISARSLRGM